MKHPPDYVDEDNNTRQYSYNDGIVYIFDTYGEMLEARYQKDLQIRQEVGKTHGTTLTVNPPSKSYTQPK